MNMQKTALGLILLASATFAEAPRTMLFQGSVSKKGNPITGTHKVVIDICTGEKLGVKDCASLYSNKVVDFKQGYYSVILGEEIPLPVFDKQYYLEVYIDDVAPENRIKLTSTPSALNAIRADSAKYAESAKTAVVANSVASKVAVTSINGLKDGVTIKAGTGMSVSPSGSTLIINGPDITNISNTSVSTKTLSTNELQLINYEVGKDNKVRSCDETNQGMIMLISNHAAICIYSIDSYVWKSFVLSD